jgi:hypothetical protein
VLVQLAARLVGLGAALAPGAALSRDHGISMGTAGSTECGVVNDDFHYI